jgi:hypothetical protein
MNKVRFFLMVLALWLAMVGGWTWYVGIWP